jgi:hypothetical protein
MWAHWWVLVVSFMSDMRSRKLLPGSNFPGMTNSLLQGTSTVIVFEKGDFNKKSKIVRKV